MSQDHSKELEDLEQLVAEPGWARLEAHVAREWGPEAYRRRVGQLLAGLPQGSDPTGQVLQLEAATREVERLMAWPRERVRTLRARTEGQPLPRFATGTWPGGGPA